MMKIEKILNDPNVKELRPEIRNELVKVSKMVEGKSPVEVFSIITSFQKNLENRGLLNNSEKAILSKAIENSLSPEDKKKVLSILSMLKK